MTLLLPAIAAVLSTPSLGCLRRLDFPTCTATVGAEAGGELLSQCEKRSSRSTCFETYAIS